MIQLLMPFPQSSSGEVVLATFKMVFSLEITPTAPTPRLGSLEAFIPLKSAFLS